MVRRFFFWAAILLSSVETALAQTAPPPAPATTHQDVGDQIFREQRQSERQGIVEQRSESLALPEATIPDLGKDPMDIEDPEPTFLIEKIEKIGDFSFNNRLFSKIVRPFLNKRLGVNRINHLLLNLNQALVEEGFITTRAYVGGQNLNNGTLQITFIPGKIEAILYNDAPLSEAPIGVKLSFPFKENDVLNLRNLEQGIDQLNRLRRNNASMKIEPGKTPGGSIVKITNISGSAAYYHFGGDNQGAPSTGTTRYRAGFDFGNVLNLMDSWNLGYTGSLDTNAFNASFSIPFGHSTFSLLATWSETQNLVGEMALMYSVTENYGFSWNYLLSRNQISKTALDLSFSYRKAFREINGAALTPQKLSVVRLGLNQFYRFPFLENIGQGGFDVGYVRGLPWLSANRDQGNIPKESAHAQFGKVDFSGSFMLPWKGVALKETLSGQWTNAALFSSEQFFIGGASSVRGFPDSVLGGDRGFLSRSELSWAQGFSLFNTVRIDPYVFFDVGGVEYIADKKHNYLSGTGIGTRFITKWGWSEMILGKSLNSPSFIEKERFRFYFNLLLGF